VATTKGLAASIYPAPTLVQSSLVTAPPLRAVKALYDFEAVEDNELTFLTGDIISVTDDSDVNWWKGRSHRGEGLFPASFVTSDLSPPTQPTTTVNGGGIKTKSVQFDANVDVKVVDRIVETKPELKIDEEILKSCLGLLRDADPTGEVADPSELEPLEEQSLAQIPLIDKALDDVDQQHNMLAEVDLKMRSVLALYDAAVHDASQQFIRQGY